MYEKFLEIDHKIALRILERNPNTKMYIRHDNEYIGFQVGMEYEVLLDKEIYLNDDSISRKTLSIPQLSGFDLYI